MGQLARAFHRIVMANVDDMVCAQGARSIQAKRGLVADNRERGASTVAEHVEHRQSQLARSQDRHGLARLHMSALKDMVTRPYISTMGTTFMATLSGIRLKVGLRNRHELPEAAAEIQSQQLEGGAAVDVSFQARRASVARQDGIHGHAIADDKAAHVWSHFLDHAAEFVTQDRRESHAAVKFSAIDVQVGAADAGAAGSHQDFAAPNLRVRSVAEMQSAIVGEDGSFHDVSAAYRKTAGWLPG